MPRIEDAGLPHTRTPAHEFDAPIAVAAPKTPGRLRRLSDTEVGAKLVGALSQDRTGHPVDAIAGALPAA